MKKKLVNSLTGKLYVAVQRLFIPIKGSKGQQMTGKCFPLYDASPQRLAEMALSFFLNAQITTK